MHFISIVWNILTLYGTISRDNVVDSKARYSYSYCVCVQFFFLSFRYFSVTRPLTYRAKRTTKRAMTMIGLAWSISFILWAPAILFWQYIVGERTVTPNHCYIQFLSEPIITFCTAIAAFYLPVSIMTFLFWKIYQETEKRNKDMQSLRGVGKSSSQAQNQGSGSGKVGGEGATNSQKDSSAMQRQMSSQSCSSDELNQSASEKNNKENTSMAGGTGSRGRCGSSCCFQFSSLLPGRHAFKRSVNTTITTVGEAEQSSSESLNIEAGGSGDQSGSDDEAEGMDLNYTYRLYVLIEVFCNFPSAFTIYFPLTSL